MSATPFQIYVLQHSVSYMYDCTFNLSGGYTKTPAYKGIPLSARYRYHKMQSFSNSNIVILCVYCVSKTCSNELNRHASLNLTSWKALFLKSDMIRFVMNYDRHIKSKQKCCSLVALSCRNARSFYYAARFHPRVIKHVTPIWLTSLPCISHSPDTRVTW